MHVAHLALSDTPRRERDVLSGVAARPKTKVAFPTPYDYCAATEVQGARCSYGSSGMPDIETPILPDHFVGGSLLIAVRSTYDLTEAQGRALEEALGRAERHITFREYVPFSGRTAEIRGLIGIHRSRRVQGELFQPSVGYRRWVHTNLTFTQGVLRGETKGEEWDEIYNLLLETAGPQPAEAEVFWSLPRAKTAFKVALPIPLLGDLPGFSEIQGVRLVQPDATSEKAELYSLILNHHTDRATVQVRFGMDVHLGQDVLSRALDQAFAIANLAVDTVADDE